MIVKEKEMLTVGTAVKLKIYKIAREQNISLNKLANICCLTQSTINGLVNGHSTNVKLLTLVRICDGLNISLSEFFDDELFENLDRED